MAYHCQYWLIFISVLIADHLDIVDQYDTVDYLDTIVRFIYSWAIYAIDIYILAEHSLAHFLYYLIPFQLTEDVRLGSQI
jgi:hypothetical protein